MALETGLKPGLVAGLKAGLNTSLFVGVDGPGVYVPLAASEFTSLTVSTPQYLWGCQDAAGDLAATLGATNLVSNGAGVAVYQAAVAGWSRKAIGSTADGDVRNWRVGAGSGPSPVAGSVAWLGYVLFPSAPAADRIVMHPAVTAPNLAVTLRTTGVLRLTCNTITTDGAYNYNDGAVHPILVVYNKTAGSVTLFTDKEQIDGTYNAGVTDTNKGTGNAGGIATGLYRYLYLLAAAGATAESYGKTTLQKLGWSLAY